MINRTFRASVDVARKEYWAAIKASKGSENRQTARAAARAALTLSIANAMEARSTALTALGAPPAPPAGAARSAYIVALQAINQTYRNSVAAADAAFAAAFPGATTAPERAVVRATLDLAIANAAVVRAAALGRAWTAPGLCRWHHADHDDHSAGDDHHCLVTPDVPRPARCSLENSAPVCVLGHQHGDAR